MIWRRSPCVVCRAWEALLSFLVLIVNFSGHACGQLQSDSNQGLDSGHVIGRIQHYGHVLLNVSVESKHLIAMLDTGASFNVLSNSLADELGKTKGKEAGSIRMLTNSQTETMLVFDDVTVDLSGLKLKGNRCSRSAFDHLAPTVGQDFDMILGMEAIRELRLHFDFSTGRVALLENVTPLNNKISFPLVENRSGTLSLSGGRCGKTLLGELMVDTGSNHSVYLASELFDKLVGSGDIHSLRKVRVADAIGIQAIEVGVLREFSIAGQTLRNLAVGRATRNSIGTKFLSRFHVDLDLKRRRIALVPNEARNGTLGMTYYSSADGRTKVVHVVENGPAYEAGISVGDEITSLNGTPVAKLPAIQRQLNLRLPPGRSIKLGIKSGDRGFSRTVVSVSQNKSAASRY